MPSYDDPSGSSGRRVLFVHPDADMRDVVTRVLQRRSHHVRAVAHSGHALLLCRTAPFDVVVVDLSGPDISGPSLAAQLRRHLPQLAFIFLANPGSPEALDQLLVRPFTADDLLQRIDAVTAAAAAAFTVSAS
jgi:DNA-binding response OmpR family regulator